jgi:hypothetical protein
MRSGRHGFFFSVTRALRQVLRRTLALGENISMPEDSMQFVYLAALQQSGIVPSPDTLDKMLDDDLAI